MQSLLNLRIQATDEAFQAWALVTQELQKTIRERDQVAATITSWQESLREKQSGSILAGELRRHHQSANELHRQWIIKDRLRQNLEQRTRAALQKWHEARQKTEILERLKSRAKMNWIGEFERHEQKLNDERATIMAFHRTGTTHLTLAHA